MVFHAGMCGVVLALVVCGLCSAQELDDVDVQQDIILNIADTNKYTDCDDVMRRGWYKDAGAYHLYLNASAVPFKVYCTFEEGGAYSTIMMRKYGIESFHRNYHDYQHGFGSAQTDYWSGLETMKQLSDQGHNRLTVTLQDWNNVIKVLRYNHFALGPWQSGYPLSIGGYISSYVLPDDLSYNNGMPFATYDVPDKHGCARNQAAGWWYNYCTYALPTGRYYQKGPYVPSAGFYDGIYYRDWAGFGYSMKYVRLDLSM